MEHICSAEDCGLQIKQGERVVQMLRGTSYSGYITPAFANVLAEWHVACFREFVLKPQTPPYKCQLCDEQIADESVFCFVIGMQTDPDHTVSERRGYQIYSVRHVDCRGAKGKSPT